MNKVLAISIVLALSIFHLGCAKTENEPKVQQPLSPQNNKDSKLPIAQVSEPTTKELMTQIENGFRDSYQCSRELKVKNQGATGASLKYSATLKCTDIESMNSLESNLKELDAKIKKVKSRKDASQDDLDMLDAITVAIQPYISTIELYNEKIKSHSALVEKLRTELGCAAGTNYSRSYSVTSCPENVMDRFTETYAKLFGGVQVDSPIFPDIKDSYFYDTYHPRVELKAILKAVSDVIKKKYLGFFSASSGTGYENKKTLSLDLYPLYALDFHLLRNDDIQTSIFNLSADQIKQVMESLLYISENGQSIAEKIFENQNSRSINVQFSTSSTTIRMYGLNEASISFGLSGKKFDLESLRSEIKIADAHASDFKSTVAAADVKYNGKLKIWYSGYSLKEFDLYGDKTDKMGGMSEENVFALTTLAQKISDSQELENILRKAEQNGKKVMFQIRLVTSPTFGVKVDDIYKNYYNEKFDLNLALTMGRTASIDDLTKVVLEVVNKEVN